VKCLSWQWRRRVPRYHERKVAHGQQEEGEGRQWQQEGQACGGAGGSAAQSECGSCPGEEALADVGVEWPGGGRGLGEEERRDRNPPQDDASQERLHGQTEQDRRACQARERGYPSGEVAFAPAPKRCGGLFISYP